MECINCQCKCHTKITNHPLYQIWSGMISRCYREKDKSYKHYGARDIKVCKRWRNSFKAFVADMGERPSKKHSINRIDNNGDYKPENCQWATQKEQSNNRRNSIYLEYNGKKHTMGEWSKIYGIPEARIRKRLTKGWNIFDAISKPVDITKSNKGKSKEQWHGKFKQALELIKEKQKLK